MGLSMHLNADEVFVEPQEDDYPASVGFRDSAANYVVVLSRFSDLEPDTGQIEIVVLDQVCTKSANVKVELSRSTCTVRLDEETAARLLGVSEYMIDLSVDEPTLKLMRKVPSTLFQGLPGLTFQR